MRDKRSAVGSECSIYVEDFAYDVIDTLLQKTFACTYLSVRRCNPKEINLVPANVILRLCLGYAFLGGYGKEVRQIINKLSQ
ncbi:hypothetical protein MKX03_031794, partial [Papaver bracteatum]